MREIKFRGKSIKDGKWVFGDLVQRKDGTKQIVLQEELISGSTTDTRYRSVGVIPETVGQFTGHTDTKDIDIYGGDIVKRKDESFVVKYLAPSFELCRSQGDDIDTEEFSTPFAMETVIGNVHENPELLT